jgi:hypothetical protein
MGKKIQLTESQLKRVIILMTEEAVGYDDFYQMFKHGGKSMEILMEYFK